MIKILLILFLILFLFLTYKSYIIENFHEKTNAVSLDRPEVLENCESCSFCDFKPDPETKNYIISRCLSQHTQTRDFKPTNRGCRQHRDLANSSGCIDGVKNFIQNIENLKEVNQDNANCRCMYSKDDSESNEKQLFNSWINTF